MDALSRRNIMLENYQNPYHRGLVQEEDYLLFNTNNESCIDNLNIQYQIKDGVISDIRFDGEACAVSTSAASLMIKTFIGKTKNEVLDILTNYEKMLAGEEYDATKLGELIVYEDIGKQPNRKRCAYLPFESLRKVLQKM